MLIVEKHQDQGLLFQLFSCGPRNFIVPGKPNAFPRLDMLAQFIQYDDARPVADDVRVHREQEESSFFVCQVKLFLPDVEDIFGGDVRPDRGEPAHSKVGVIVQDPFHRKLDYAGLLPSCKTS